MSVHFLLRNYLKIIFRQLSRNKLFTSINVFGLAVGLSIAFFIALFILNELSYENMHSKRDRIFRLTMHIQNANYDMHWARHNLDWTNNIPTVFPEIEELIRFQDYDPRDILVGEDNYKIPHAFSTDAEVFDVFDFNLIRGNPATALQEPQSVVLTKSLARKFFGSSDPMNKEITFLDKNGTEKKYYKVTGIMADLPSNTHFPVNLLTSFDSTEARTGWAFTYLLLKPESSADQLYGKMPDFIKKNMIEGDNSNFDLPLQPIASIHLHSDLAREIKLNGNISHIYIFGIVGLFVLLLSGINFINLNVAQSLKRIKEIGIRKTLGSSKGNLVIYFLLEANVITMLASILGIMTVIIALPYFNQFIPVAIPVLQIIPFAIFNAIVLGCFAGLYPAFILTKSAAIDAIKSKNGFNPSKRRYNLKNGLVAFQLILCISLISSALITESQFRYMVEKKLGLDKEQILAITNIPDEVKFKYHFLQDQLNQIPGVEGVAASMEVPSRAIRDTGPIYAEGMVDDPQNAPTMDIQIIDENFIDLMNVEMLAGRNFSERERQEISKKDKDNLIDYLQSQPREYIINETAMKMAGWQNPEEALGKAFGWSIGGINLQRGPVIGVIKDFHQESLRNKIDPVVMINEPIWVRSILVKMDGKSTPQSMASIQEIWKSNFPEFAMEHAFLDEMYNRLYENEQRQLQLIYIFSSLAILIAFLGIFGMLSYTLKTREKEIAVRKILGANLSSLFLLLSKNFIVLTLLGFLITIPITWYMMDLWLQNYVYRIDITFLSFMVAAGIILLVLGITISLQMGKVASNNPSRTLRAE
ncbi:FtsX-like permease family protein [Flexithrix dorotheae]|uniref:FtsX-like permease family protein n=1 Tax=Flexithrix dorotheae TaxID=70993 RepID=UPI0003734D25|nr:FtsX-like permease family protein [Flexithrix dorotheae]